MGKPKIPTIPTIMAEKGCSRNRAESLQALYEARADMEYRRQTGRHFLEIVSAEDFRRNPPPAVC